MNKERRTKLQSIADKISDLRDEIRELCEEEQGAFDNLPDSIQGSSKGGAMEAAVQNMDDAADGLEHVIDELQDAQSQS